MTLKEHLDLLGHSVRDFAYITKIPKSVIQRAIDGLPIAAPHAERIVQQLSNEHALPPQKGIQVSDIKGLQVVAPAALKRNN
jgi:hypothetical protein